MSLIEVSTHSRLKAAGVLAAAFLYIKTVSTHSRLKAAGFILYSTDPDLTVSTHSRLKAAGGHSSSFKRQKQGFNTQPPEGGWLHRLHFGSAYCVSTHSRLKAAGFFARPHIHGFGVSTHSRLKAAGLYFLDAALRVSLFQHTAA